VPCCHPYGVRAMWSVRSRRRRLGTGPGSLGMDAGLAVDFLARGMRLTGGTAAGMPAAVPPVSLIPRARIHAVASPNRSSTLGRHRVPAADRPAAFEDRCSTGPSVAHVRNDDHPAQLHGIVTTLKRWACGWELYRVDGFQTASSIEACSDHV